MTRASRSLVLGLVSAALASTLVACGGSDSGDAAAPADTSTSTASAPDASASTDGAEGTFAPTSDDPTFSVVSQPTILPGDPVPAPTGKVVLTLTDVANPNVGDELQFDLATLNELGVVQYTVFDRQAEGRDVTFSGPLVSSLLDVAGVSGTTMHTVALNDYSVDVPVVDARELPLMLATRADGKKMTVAHYGPTRFVYPTNGYDLDQTVYDPRWIWQLASIQVS